jgi:hypothetical protein
MKEAARSCLHKQLPLFRPNARAVHTHLGASSCNPVQFRQNTSLLVPTAYFDNGVVQRKP